MKIDVSEVFTHLENAPIVEAIIHWEAKGERALEPDVLLRELKSRLPKYPRTKLQHELHMEAKVAAAGPKIEQRHELQWNGVRAETADGLNIVQFRPTGLVFSRLAPYRNWEEFRREAMDAWSAFNDLAMPVEVSRLGVRFINRVGLSSVNEVWEIIRREEPKLGQMSVAVEGFFHQEIFDASPNPYRIRLLQTIQPSLEAAAGEQNLIIDIDVFTKRPIIVSNVSFDAPLAEMHWLKNKVFFEAITDKAINRFRGVPNA